MERRLAAGRPAMLKGPLRHRLGGLSRFQIMDEPKRGDGGEREAGIVNQRTSSSSRLSMRRSL